MISLKLVTIFVLVIAICKNAGAGAGDDKFRQLLEDIKKRMCDEIKALGLPRLEPLEIKKMEKSIGDAKFGVENFKLSGLSDFKIESTKVDPLLLKLAVDIELKGLELESDYTAIGDVGMIYLNGKGRLKLSVNKIMFQLQVRLLRIDGVTSVDILKLNVEFKELQLKITGLFPDKTTNAIINEMINEIGKELFDDLWEEKREDIYKVVSKLASEPVKDLTPRDLINLVTSGKPIFGEDDPENCV